MDFGTLPKRQILAYIFGILGPEGEVSMTEQVEIKRGTDQTALVRRVVPGQLVYVEMEPEEVYAVKLNSIVIRQPDGSYVRYRGEPLSELGLDSGSRVIVWTDSPGSPPRNLVVDAKLGSPSILESTLKKYFRR